MTFFQSLLCSTLFSLPLIAFQYEVPWGKDSDMAQIKSRNPYQMPITRKEIPARMAEAIISFHQNVISPTSGPRSHFRPSSSQYMKLAIRRYGFIQGYLMGCDRLLRENKDPWVYRTIAYGDTLYKFDPAVK